MTATLSPRSLHIFGAGMRARVVVDQLAWHFADTFAISGFWDDGKPAGSTGPGGFPILGTVDDGLAALPGTGSCAFLAHGTYRSWPACGWLARLQASGVEVVSLVAPTAHISPTARLGANAFVAAGVYIGAEVVAGNLMTAHGGVTVEHHAIIGDNVLLAPGATLCGVSRVESHCFIGSGSRVIPEVTVGAGSITGAGAVVVRDLPRGVVATGVPARITRAVRSGDEAPPPDVVARLLESTPS